MRSTSMNRTETQRLLGTKQLIVQKARKYFQMVTYQELSVKKKAHIVSVMSLLSKTCLSSNPF